MVAAPPPANYQPSTGISVTTVRPMRKRFVALVSLLLFCPFASDFILTQSCPLFLAHCAPPDCTPYYTEHTKTLKTQDCYLFQQSRCTSRAGAGPLFRNRGS